MFPLVRVVFQFAHLAKVLDWETATSTIFIFDNYLFALNVRLFSLPNPEGLKSLAQLLADNLQAAGNGH